MPERTRIDLLRHGRCEGGDIFRGSTDVALTAEGLASMRAQIARHAAPPWQRIVSSPLQRCRSFAEETAQQLALPLAVDPDLREMHFGDWEGREIAELWEADPQLKLWSQDPGRHSVPGGETLAAFAERVNRALENLLASHKGEHLLVITHGGVIRLLLTQAQSLARNQLREMEVPYAHIAQLEYRDRRLIMAERQTEGSLV